MAIQNGCTINQFFPPIEPNESDNNESDNNEIENVDSDASSTESETEIELEELIHLIEIKLQDKTLVSEQQWRLTAILQYLQLLRFNRKKYLQVFMLQGNWEKMNILLDNFGVGLTY